MDKRDAERFMSSRLKMLPTFLSYVTPIAPNHVVSWANEGAETVKFAILAPKYPSLSLPQPRSQISGLSLYGMFVMNGAAGAQNGVGSRALRGLLSSRLLTDFAECGLQGPYEVAIVVHECAFSKRQLGFLPFRCVHGLLYKIHSSP